MSVFSIYGGRTSFWQWDLGQRLIVSDDTCSEVHFDNGTTEKALINKVYEVDGIRLVDVPSIFLQSDRLLKVFGFIKDETGQYTECADIFPVIQRAKPEDYTYPEAGGYYIPLAIQTSNEVLQIAFKASEFGMEAVDPVDVILPVGPQGEKGDKGDKGDQGIRGSKMLKVDYAPSAYTTTTGGFTPKYRMSLQTIIDAVGSTDIKVGDIVLSGWNYYSIGYLNNTYAYLSNYRSIRGETGADGVGIASVEQTATSTEDGGDNVFTVMLTNGKSTAFTVQNGSKGSTGEQGIQGEKGEKGDTGAQGPQGEKGDPGEVNIDDTRIGADAWSSKNTVDKLCPAFEETGSAVKCEPVEGYPLSVVSIIDPGTVGVGGLSLCHTAGKNLFNKNLYLPSAVHLNGKKIGGTPRRSIIFPVAPNTTYTVNHELPTSMRLGTATKVPAAGDVVTKYVARSGSAVEPLTIMTGPDDTWMVVQLLVNDDYYNGYTVEQCAESLQIELGDTATAYEPYYGQTVSTGSFGETVYGGSLDWNSGVLTVTHGSDGAELAEPYTIQLTPQEILGLEGLNVLYTYTGNITVSGRIDPMTIIEKQKTINEDLLDRVAALEAAVVNNT